MKYEYSGTSILKHASGNEDLKKLVNNYKGLRYDGDGGVFGGSGVYLDADGKWTTKDTGMRWYFKKAYDVKAPMDRAFILTPESYGEIVKPKYPLEEILKKDSFSRSETLVGGKEIARRVKNKGYDALIVEGWDDLAKEIARDAEVRGISVKDDSLGGYTSYMGRGRYPKEEEMYREMIKTFHPGVREEYLNNLGKYGVPSREMETLELLKRGMNPDVGQDQVIHFNKPALEVLGEASGATKPYRFSNYINRLKSLAPILKPLGYGMAVLEAAGYSDPAAAATNVVLPGGLGESNNSPEQKMLDRRYLEKLRSISERKK